MSALPAFPLAIERDAFAWRDASNRIAFMPAIRSLAQLFVCACLSFNLVSLSYAAALPPALQGELDRSVLAYEKGQLKAARRGFENLSRRGVAAADFNLAVMHLRGEMPASSQAIAQALLLRAAQAQFVTAQFMLGQALQTGRFGPPDLPQANRWFALAATGGSVEAQVAIATAHYLGRGTPQDYVAAARWYREAATSGDIGAQYLLASMYEHGDGLPRDLRLARYWYAVAAGNGDDAAPGKLKEIDAALASSSAAAPASPATARP